MNFTEAIQSGFQNYANFKGRAQRSAFWFWNLFAFIVYVVATLLDQYMLDYDGPGPIYGLCALALIIPSLAVGARRLHDIDRTGWWQLLSLTVVGTIVLIVWWVSRGQPGPNRFGPNPLGE
ncbi:MAG: DUF805 domain-containing protein [Pseudorhodoplanes sp.]|uniref:DUF805 domain-containing protein n=1 Tax=Pseudorhodoplanes sp. TaxID=1934341 RepID=UPI003D0D4CA9